MVVGRKEMSMFMVVKTFIGNEHLFRLKGVQQVQ